MCYVVIRRPPCGRATAAKDVDDVTTLVESMDATANIFVYVDEAEKDEPQKQARK